MEDETALTNVTPGSVDPAGQVAAGDAAPVILVVEDLPDLRGCVVEYFRIAGFDVVEADNAGAARAALNESHVDVVFSDINMPGTMDGIGLASWLATQQPDLPVVLTSAVAPPELKAAPRRRFVKKPYQLDVVENEIRRLVAPRSAA
jgi:DNA-binding NtrC family response regulator